MTATHSAIGSSCSTSLCVRIKSFIVGRERLLLLSQRLQVTNNLHRLPFIAAVQFVELSVRRNHRRAQRMEYLILSGFSVVKITQAKKLRDAFHFVRGSAGEFPVLKG